MTQSRGRIGKSLIDQSVVFGKINVDEPTRCNQLHRQEHKRLKAQADERMTGMRLMEDTEFRDLIRERLRQATNWNEQSSATKAKQLQVELVRVRDQHHRLLDQRMLEEVDADTFASKNRELRDKTAN